MGPVNNVIPLFGMYEVYFKGTYVATCRNRECASKLMAALKQHPNKKPEEVIKLLKAG